MTKYVVLFSLMPLFAWSQYLLPNEEAVFSFKTNNGKIMTLVKDKNCQSQRRSG
ncbi:hypothetical protein [Chryseobacterium sp. BLS98]|uniref:hypothetical protein n=1 Tax=Chryseobacterium sp. BLS98 TaxID=885586 RepID=UPI000AA400D9|nr:hypothetical protein [Chryseobacterium sp. BLS98]